MSQGTLEKKFKSLITPVLIPPTMAVMRYGANSSLKRWVWKTICNRIRSREHPFTIKTQPGFRFAGNTEDLIASYVYYFGVWEPTITAWISSLPLAGRTVIDVGAHHGWHSLLAAQCVGPQGRVVSIEASPSCFAGLRRNIDLNDYQNIRSINTAAWSTFGTLRLFEGKEGNSATTTVVPEFAQLGYGGRAVKQGGLVEIPAAPLSALLTAEEISKAALVKIDVEGAEFPVVETLIPLFPKFPQDVRFIIELTPEVFEKSGTTPEDFLRLFTNAGFRPYVIPNEYGSDFYIDNHNVSSVKVTELKGKITRQMDIVFSRLPIS